MPNGGVRDSTLSAFIWKNAEDLWGDFKHVDFGKIILPFTLLRRLECVLEPTRDAVIKSLERIKGSGIDVDLILRQATKLPFYNTTKYSLGSLGGTRTRKNLESYIAGFSPNARVIFEQFDFGNTISRLEKANVLFKICQNFGNTDLHPKVVPDRVMSNVYEHLIRRFGAEVNEAAEDFMTPRDIVHLATTLLLDPDDKLFQNNPGLIRTLYDPTCGTGGFLTDAMNHVDSFRNRTKVPPVLIPYGQELEPETHAVALASMLLRTLESDPGRDLSKNIAGPASTLSDDRHAGERFHYCLSNPPFGKKWEKDQDAVLREAREKGFNGRFGAGTPRVTDGSMLFLLHLIDKLARPEKGGGRAAIILSGSPLYNGSAGQGESEIRRWILENDFVEAVVGLPTDIFFRTGIGTFIWLLTNKKSKKRKGKVQLIDASGIYSEMHKNEGNKRRFISEDQIQTITRIYSDFEDTEISKIVPYQDFGYRRVRVQRPMRMSIRPTEDRITRLKATKPWNSLSTEQQAVWEKLLSKHKGETHTCAWIESLVRNASSQKVAGRVPKTLGAALISSLGERDPGGEVVLIDDKAMPDKEFEDFENVPLAQSIADYVIADVLPHVPDAWVDETYTDDRDGNVGKLGYEINFNRYFYRYEAPRALSAIEAEIKQIEADVARLLVEQELAKRSITKGIDLNVPMKESGVAWLGRVPTHWRVQDFWTIATQISIAGLPKEGLLSVYLDRGVIPYSEGGGLVHKPSESLDKYQLVEPGNFVLNNQQAWRGSVGVSRHRGIVSPAYLVFQLSDLDPEYANFLFRSPGFVEQMMLASQGVGDIQRQIKKPLLRKIRVPLPPIAEQLEIVEEVQRRTSRADDIISRTERSIELLKEYRTAAIAAAVTGQLHYGQTL